MQGRRPTMGPVFHMSKAFKILFGTLGALLLLLVAAYVLVMRGTLPVNIVPNARTLYTGSVGIEHKTLSEIREALEVAGCLPQGAARETYTRCVYREAVIQHTGTDGLVVYPHGVGFGPLSFSLSEDMLYATKDISGPPDSKKFKEEVRQDVAETGHAVEIREDAWGRVKTEYPWTVLY